MSQAKLQSGSLELSASCFLPEGIVPDLEHQTFPKLKGVCTSSLLGLYEGSENAVIDSLLAMLGSRCAALNTQMCASAEMTRECCLSGLSIESSALLKGTLWRCIISSLMGLGVQHHVFSCLLSGGDALSLAHSYLCRAQAAVRGQQL